MSVPGGQLVAEPSCPSGKSVGQNEMSTYLSSVQWVVQFDPYSMSHCFIVIRFEPLTHCVLLTPLMALWVDPMHRPLTTDNS
jgi:non-ribosomal peptide synthetase component E (peptide arylation enzyme)